MSNSTNNSSIKVVFFDLGGVVLASPLKAIEAYSLELGLPKNYINFVISNWGSDGPFQKYERGEIEFPIFIDTFYRALNSPESYYNYSEKYPAEKFKKVEINGLHIYKIITSVTSKPNEDVVNAIKYLKSLKTFKVMALTNDFKPEDQQSVYTEVLGLFDHVVHSYQIKMRKPEKRFFEYAFKQAKINYNEAIFLDDIGGNLKPARELGIKTILVKQGKSIEALEELGQALGIDIIKELPPHSKL